MSIRLLKSHFLILMYIATQTFTMSNCSNILIIPFLYRSHLVRNIILGTELHSRGHNVTMILSESYPHKEDIPKDLRVLTYATKYPDFYTIPSEENGDGEITQKFTPLQDMRWHYSSFEFFCFNILEDENLHKELSESAIDLAVVDALNYAWCNYIMLHNLKIKYISMTTIVDPWMLRSPALPSFVPFMMTAEPYTSSMTLMEKVRNFLTSVDWAAFPGIRVMEDSFVQKYINPELNNPPVTYSKLSTNSLLWLIDADWTMEYPRPVMPNEINIGGLSARPAKPLTGDIKTFVDGATEGLILVSFGTHDVMSPKLGEKFLGAFRKIPQYRIMMRYAKDVPKSLQEKVPKNVKLAKWVPLNDILGHNNTKLFISHGGANSLHEALYHAVPLITMPFMVDQPYNGLKAKHFGCGLTLDFLTFTAEDLLESINEIMKNKSYSENMLWRSRAFRAAKETPRERAAWWIEYVMKYGAQHLRAQALDMPWYEYLMLDLLLVLVVLPVSLVTCCITSIFCCLKNKYSARNTQAGKKNGKVTYKNGNRKLNKGE